MNPRILCIETSENYCSVAVSEGKHVLLQKIDFSERNHSQILTVLINNLLSELNLNIASIDAISISKGPGSYTGLRIGVSVAKGICYAAQKPLISVNTLEIMCYAAQKEINFSGFNEHTLLCPMIDARRMEVYMQFFSPDIVPIGNIEAKIIASSTFNDLLSENAIIFFGSGADKISPLYDTPNAIFLKNIRPLAEYMAIPSFNTYLNKKFEDVAYFEPFYLKNFIPTRSSKNLLGT